METNINKNLNKNGIYSDFINEIIKSKNDNALFFFIGAGVSISQGYPTWDDYVEQLIEYWKFNLPNIYKKNTSENNDDFSFKDLNLLNELKQSTMSKKRKIDYVNYLIKKRCEKIAENEKYDSDFYYQRESLDFEKFLFSEIVPINAVNSVLDELMNIKSSFITTNYDNQIEKSYDNKFGIKPSVVSDFSSDFKEITDSTIIHLHGTPTSDPKFFINSSTNYSKIYFGKSLNTYREKLEMLFKNKHNVSIIFIGCSMEEDEVLSLFDLKDEKYKFYSIMKYDSNEPELSDFTNEYYRKTKNIQFIWYGEKFEELPIFLHQLNDDINKNGMEKGRTPEDIEKILLG